MNAVKHTPGPWELDDLGNVCSQAVHNIALVFSSSTREGWSGSDLDTQAHCEANARLIAAAPCLLEAAKLVLEWYEAEDDHSKADFYERMQMCRDSEQAIRSAIAEAEGGAA